MRIFLIRHGFSEGNEDHANYKKRGDSKIGLTDLGWRQAIAAGAFIQDYMQRHPARTDARPPRVWSSPFVRARETAAGIFHGANGALSPQTFRTNPMLVEQDFGFYPYVAEGTARQQHNLRELFDVYSASYRQDKYWAKPPFGESPLDVQVRLYPFLGVLMRDRDNGIDDTFVVTHGVTLRALAMAFLKIDSDRYPAFTNPENCSIYVIEGKKDGYYSFRQIYNGETMQAVDINWGQKLGAYYAATLPPVPPHLHINNNPPQPVVILSHR